MSTPLSGLRTVEIEVNSRCNRACSYCPVSVLPLPPVPKFMSDEVFDKVLLELASIDYRGRVSYHFYNEPLLRRDLERLVARCAEVVPLARQVLFTNGELLTDARHASLMQAGLSFVVVTSHDGTPHPEREGQFVQFASNLELTNRGGTMTNLPSSGLRHLVTPCWAPSEMLVVTVTGDVVLCYEDAHRKHVVGNLFTQSIREVWAAPEWVAIRDALERGDRAAGPAICRACTNVAHARPGMSDRSEPFWEHLEVAWG